MKKSVIFMLPGHGSQFYGMGEELFDKNQVFRDWMLALDGIIKDKINVSILNFIYDKTKNKGDLFNNTLHSHLSILMLEYALVRTLIDSGIKPDFLLGYSMGELVASSLAGIVPIEDVISSIIKQAELIEAYCADGRMLAILENLSFFNRNSIIYKNSELASINFDSHFVVSGQMKKIQIIEEFLKKNDIVFQMLPAEYAFHSILIEPIALCYNKYISALSYKRADIPVVSCLRAQTIREINEDHFWTVVREPVLFKRTIERLEDDKACDNTGYIYLDAGPSGNLAAYVKNIISHESKSQVYAVLSPFGSNLHNINNIFSSMKNIQQESAARCGK